MNIVEFLVDEGTIGEWRTRHMAIEAECRAARFAIVIVLVRWSLEGLPSDELLGSRLLI